MTTKQIPQWQQADEGWGRKAVDVATLPEPQNVREYVGLHQLLGVAADDLLLDVVTSFRGIWGTTPEVLDEVLRVLRPGGRFGMTVWGHLKVSPPMALGSASTVIEWSSTVTG